MCEVQLKKLKAKNLTLESKGKTNSNKSLRPARDFRFNLIQNGEDSGGLKKWLIETHFGFDSIALLEKSFEAFYGRRGERENRGKRVRERE